MSNIGNFKRVGREVVYKGKILEFCQDEIQTSKGHHVTWDFLNHKGAAAIVPVMDDGKILMVKQWRNVVNRVSLEIPAGAKDTVEEPTLECATRELEEETGYKPGRMERIYTEKPNKMGTTHRSKRLGIHRYTYVCHTRNPSPHITRTRR